MAGSVELGNVVDVSMEGRECSLSRKCTLWFAFLVENFRAGFGESVANECSKV
jgi:hypothetical protein